MDQVNLDRKPTQHLKALNQALGRIKMVALPQTIRLVQTAQKIPAPQKRNDHLAQHSIPITDIFNNPLIQFIMSQVVTRSDVNQVSEVQIGNLFSAPIALAGIIYGVGSIAVNELITGSVDLSSTTVADAVSRVTIKSPQCVNNSFIESFTKQMNACNQKIMDPLASQQQALLVSLCTVDYSIRPESRIRIEQLTHEVLHAKDEATILSASSALIQHIQEDHALMFRESVAVAVQSAVVKSGFSRIALRQEAHTAVIIGQNENGQALISEVRMDEQGKVDLVSETLGFSDGACSVVMKQFDYELAEAGIKYRRSDAHWTLANRHSTKSVSDKQPATDDTRNIKEPHRQLNRPHQQKITLGK